MVVYSPADTLSPKGFGGSIKAYIPWSIPISFFGFSVDSPAYYLFHVLLGNILLMSLVK
jgi:hypothetical protein